MRSPLLSSIFDVWWLLFGISAAVAQPGLITARTSIPLTLETGRPLRVELEKRVTLKQDAPVIGRLTEPVYSYDRIVIPEGCQVLGHVAQLTPVPRIARLNAILGGDFTPLHEAHLEFDSILLPDGRRIAIHTYVRPGTRDAVHVAAAKSRKAKVASWIGQARVQIRAKKKEALAAIKAPGKWRKIRDLAVAHLPYHPQYLPAGMRFNADLLSPVMLGTAIPDAVEFPGAGNPPYVGNVVRARLITGLDSAEAKAGTPVEAALSLPLFSMNHALLLPEGTRLKGRVVQARHARWFRRNGQLRFLFESVEVPAAAPRALLGVIEGVEIGKGERVRLDEEGGMVISNSNLRFVMPALSLAGASWTDDSDNITNSSKNMASSSSIAKATSLSKANTERGPNRAGRALGGFVGFGYLGSALGQTSHAVGFGIGLYGVARSIYVSMLARGREVSLAPDTPMDIRLGDRRSSHGTKKLNQKRMHQ